MARSEFGKVRKNSAECGQPKNRGSNDRSAFYPEWLDLQGLTDYAAISERTLRTWIHSDVDPLPAVRKGGKFLVNRRAFDTWLLAHGVTANGKTKRAEAGIDESHESNTGAVSEDVREDGKALARPAQARCIFDWADGPRCGRLLCVIHKQHKNSAVVVSSPATLKEMFALGILTGQAFKDARTASNEGANENRAGHCLEDGKQIKRNGG